MGPYRSLVPFFFFFFELVVQIFKSRARFFLPDPGRRGETCGRATHAPLHTPWVSIGANAKALSRLITRIRVFVDRLREVRQFVEAPAVLRESRSGVRAACRLLHAAPRGRSRRTQQQGYRCLCSVIVLGLASLAVRLQAHPGVLDGEEVDLTSTVKKRSWGDGVDLG